MKTLKQYCQQNNLILAPIRYRHHFGYCTRKGYDILKQDGKILVSFEPCEYQYSKHKWYIRHAHKGFKGAEYISRITTKYLQNIDINADSFMTNLSAINPNPTITNRK